MIEGRPIRSGAVTHSVSVRLGSKDRVLPMDLDVTALGSYPVVLGIQWLRKNNPLTICTESKKAKNGKQPSGLDMDISNASLCPSV